MSPSNDGYSFDISVDDFDKSVLPSHARTPGTDDFSQEVNKFFEKEFATFKGRVRILVEARKIHVSWQSDPGQPHPLRIVQEKLDRQEFSEAIRLLEILRRYQPDDVAVLYSLGLALSDAGQPDLAEVHLRHALEVAPDHVNARVALGVALIRQDRYADAILVLREAVAQEPNNPWAQRNLGGCLLHLGEVAEAEQCLRRAVELNPTDQQAVFGLAQVLHEKGELKEADVCYAQVIELDSRTSVAEAARQERTKLAQQSFRKAMPSSGRPDAIMYCFSALQKFDKMNQDEIRKIGFEIALLGQKGLDTNDSAQKYRLKSLPGQFSGLNLVCLMYVAFKKVAPHQNIGFDLTKEFEVAKTMHEKGEKP